MLVALALLLVAAPRYGVAQNWTLTSAPSNTWRGIAMSADGSELVAVGGTSIYTSTNGGGTWISNQAPEQLWSAVASSATGRKLVAVAQSYDPYSGGVWVSTNSGTTWTRTSPSMTNNLWYGAALSADGRKCAVIDSGGYRYPGLLFSSTNFGDAWANPLWVSAPEQFASVAASADGNRFIAGATWFLYRSGDCGQTWIQTSTSDGQFNNPCSGLACSADGNNWLAVRRGGESYVSTDAGATWTTTSAPTIPWQSVASSADGTKLVAVSDSGPIYTSANSGISWSGSAAPSTNWQFVASSADGCKLAAVVNGGGIYVWQTTPTPILNIACSDTNAVLAWLVPSMPCVLQENTNLNSPDWTPVAATPNLNFTNLNYQVSLPTGPDQRFYRLKAF